MIPPYALVTGELPWGYLHTQNSLLLWNLIASVECLITTFSVAYMHTTLKAMPAVNVHLFLTLWEREPTVANSK